jgi:hypothetical protein
VTGAPDPTAPPPAALFRGVDRAVFLTAFAERLRGVGVDVALNAIERCAMAMAAVGAPSLDDLYWLLRLSLVRDRTQLPAFDAVFDAVFAAERPWASEWRGDRAQRSPDDLLLGLRRSAPNAPATTGGVPWTTLPSIGESDGDATEDGEDGEDPADDSAIPELVASAVAAEVDRPFDRLDDEALERVGRLLEASVREWPQRRTRRQRLTRGRGGPVALRRSMRDALDTGGEVLTLVHTRPRRRPRPVVVLIDVSGSMEAYARAYLHLTRPLAIRHRAEVFAFATELTRITPVVRLRSPADAIDGMTEQVGDRFSGTRLASSVRALLHHRTWSTMVRGAVVVVCSDGWDTDPPELLSREMCRLGRLAHRVVWVNPRAGMDGFEPTTGGMAAALPHCDELLAGHDARSMRVVIDAITAA